MTKKLLSAAFAVLAGFAVASAQAACEDNWKDCAGKPWVDGDSMDTPMGSIWWPHPIWGEGDQAGSTNWYKKPEVVMRALGAVKEGKTYRLGHEYHSGMPMFGQRKWVIRIPASPTGGPVGQNKIIWHDEFLATEIGQAGTQFDGLGHVGVQVGEDGDKTNMRFYNGYTVQEMQGAYGLAQLGTEKLHPIVARGVLIDFTLVHGDMAHGTCANMDDLKMVLEKQGMADFEFAEGDALLFRYNWERHWTDPCRLQPGHPGHLHGRRALGRRGRQGGRGRGRHLAGDGPGSLSGRAGVRVLRPQLPPDPPRHRHPGEPGPDAARGRQGIRLRVSLLAVPDPRRDRFARLADRGTLSA